MYQANILLVDDETAILQLLTTILEKEGFSHITTATSAELALSLTRAKQLRFNYFRCHASWTIWF